MAGQEEENIMKQYFDHYLKGAPAPDWKVNGGLFLKKKK
jgi:hypothetical protein